MSHSAKRRSQEKRKSFKDDEGLLKVDKYHFFSEGLIKNIARNRAGGHEGGQTTFCTDAVPPPQASTTSSSSQLKCSLFGDETLYELSFPRYDVAYLGLTPTKPLVLTRAGRKAMRAPWKAACASEGESKVHPLRMSRLRADYPRSFSVMEGLQPYGTSKAHLFPEEGELTHPSLPEAVTRVEMLSPECAKQLAPRLTGAQERLSGQSRYVGFER
ncbi:hypothetical protein FOL47_001240 [Perkinsus chesapeaki]|uniref:Uncharacterized protein n=1 Tax=Perkinsus chesapeaki TaxID=330153 RepID=A0A7J6MJE7_PERCH|nr:hypothetical protein FOL47_001240 [Perkinsus chesapeaki]